MGGETIPYTPEMVARARSILAEYEKLQAEEDSLAEKFQSLADEHGRRAFDAATNAVVYRNWLAGECA